MQTPAEIFVASLSFSIYYYIYNIVGVSAGAGDETCRVGALSEKEKAPLRSGGLGSRGDGRDERERRERSAGAFRFLTGITARIRGKQ